MGISGHMLGPRKLRRLSRLSGLDLDRAYIRGRYAEGRVRPDSATCLHFSINPQTGESEQIEDDDLIHWSSCPPTEGRGLTNGKPTPPYVPKPHETADPPPPRYLGPRFQ